MPRRGDQKLKLLYLLDMLREKTDEDNTMTLAEMITELGRYGIPAERKSIYADLRKLQWYGLDVIQRKSDKLTTYFVANRPFQLPELRLLVDAVQSAKFVTREKSEELIKKIQGLASERQAQSLQRQVDVSGRIKTSNKNIYYNVDCLHTAISENKKVSFQYFHYNIDGERIFKNNGDKYVVSPYALSWDDENYYLIASSMKRDDFAHYRVDRMTTISPVDEKRDPLPPGKENFNIAEYTKNVFNMFGGEKILVELQFDHSLASAVFDRFGQEDVMITKKDEHHFCIGISVAVSTTFFAWISQFGSKVKIRSPERVIDQYKLHLSEILDQYRL